MFLIIPYLIIPPLVSSDKKKKWKPSKREAQEAFLLHLNEHTEVEPTLERLRAKCLTNGDTFQPLPLIVGNQFDNLKAYIVIDSYLFNIENTLSCMDICFKLYHTLQARYPIESKHLWYFLQKYIYDITEAGDTQYVGVNSFMTDLCD